MKTFIIIVAVCLVLAGIVALFNSGLANYSAFMNEGSGDNWRFVWGMFGAAIALTSAVTFGAVVWLYRNGNKIGAIRAVLLFVIAFAGSIYGNYAYMNQNAATQNAKATQQANSINQIEANLAQWRAEVSQLPPSTKTAESLERYIKEVERVGRSHQLPYRQAVLELGEIEYRKSLETKIDGAVKELATFTPITPASSSPIRRWLSAVLLEIIASQTIALSLIIFAALSDKARFEDWRSEIDDTYV